ncbi:hypothetical protein LB505_010252 [Fusarium chuoi]|nr:hypothetical protein LB505_010252 [Fusarium chuoi]
MAFSEMFSTLYMSTSEQHHSPGKHKDAMRKAFRNAMRGLRKVKKDQDVQDVETDEQDQADDDGTADDAAGDGVW